MSGRRPGGLLSGITVRRQGRVGTMPKYEQAGTGVSLHHPLSFWAGTLVIFVGVASHLPMALRDDDKVAAMPIRGTMLIAMALILAGLALAAYGLIPRRSALSAKALTATVADSYQVMDDTPLSAAHWRLLTVLGIALAIDVMKPATLGFVVPGLRVEYGLPTISAAALPLIALTGTTVGSLMWGYLADRIGRRASILLASLFFMATAVCGLMPTFGWNLFMCFLMGASAGGMLPIVYALMAEAVPAKNRGWLVVLHGGLGSVGGYAGAAGLAALLEPRFGWRILWLVGLPTGALMLVLNRWIPESPRFLLERGRVEEASVVMLRFGALLREPGALPPQDMKATTSATRRGGRSAGLGTLFRHPYLQHTSTVGVYGLAWGLINWGFITFLPTMLGEAGAGRSANRILSQSALIAIPGTLVVAWLYGRWSSKKSMILYAVVAVLALVGFALLNPGAPGSSRLVLTLLLVVLLVSTGGVISMLSPYTAEVYPTHLRGTGSGLAAGSSKLGGMVGPPVVAVILALSSGFTVVSLLVAVPMAMAAVIVALLGVETRSRPLEAIGPAAANASDGVRTEWSS